MYLAVAKLATFATDTLWKSCFKFNFYELSFSMSVAKVASLAVANLCLATAELEIFATDILWESCSKYNVDQLSHSISVANIASIAVADFQMRPRISIRGSVRRSVSP